MTSSGPAMIAVQQGRRLVREGTAMLIRSRIPGCRVVTAVRPEELFDLYREQVPEIALLDIDGCRWDAIGAAIRLQRAWPNARFVAMCRTGVGSATVQQLR